MIKLKEIIVEYQELLKNISPVKRDFRIEPGANYVITGVRRSGKTWFLFQIIKELFGPNSDKVLYMNFEDERLVNFGSEDFDALLYAYYEIYPDLKPVLFLDEIQNVVHWEKFCRRIADQKYRVYVTGSNANMLSSDIATTLGARFLPLEMKPLSFYEFLRFHKISVEPRDLYGSKTHLLKKLFQDYFHYGGFPDVIDFNDKRSYLQSIYTTIVYSDIVVKNKIRDANGLRMLVKKIAESTGKEVSYNRLKNILIASGTRLSTTTVISWVTNLKDAFLISDIRNVNYKFADREVKKKYYFVDTGFLYILGENSDSKLLETLAYNSLRSFHEDLFFFKSNKAEVDFVIPGKELYQVSVEMNRETTKEREINALIRVSEYLNINNLTILTYDYEDEIPVHSKIIKIVPLWKFMLEQTIKRR